MPPAVGTAPPCGGVLMRRLFGADSLRSEGTRIGPAWRGVRGAEGFPEPPGSPIGPAWLAGRQRLSVSAEGRLRPHPSGKVPFPLGHRAERDGAAEAPWLVSVAAGRRRVERVP